MDDFNCFSDDLLKSIDLNKIPNHVAIIMDGNRRWAKLHNQSSYIGHAKGAEALTQIVKAAKFLGIKTLTVFAFSTENWGRSSLEISGLMKLFELYLERKKEQMVRDRVRIGFIGDLSGLPLSVKHALLDAIEATKHIDNGIDFVLAINYGARDEIKRAVVKIVEDKIDAKNITIDLISSYLDTAKYKDPELLIRTSGEMRLSNFLLWQLSYAEIVSSETLWPDFNPQSLLDALKIYQQRNRRLGE